MKLSNGIDLEIRKSFYNKSKVQEDGITHIIDTTTNYPVYQFGMAKNYFDIEDKSEVVKEIIGDLQSTIEKLQQMLEQDRQKSGQNER